MNGAVPFVYLHSCGCTFSHAGLKAMIGPLLPNKNNLPIMESSEREKLLCPQCGAKYDPIDDVFTLNPNPEEEERMMERLLIYNSSVKTKSKKRKAVETGVEPPSNDGKPSNKKTQLDPSSAKSASQSKKIAEGLAEEEKRRLANMSDAVKSIYQGKQSGVQQNWISQGTFTRVGTMYSRSRTISDRRVLFSTRLRTSLRLQIWLDACRRSGWF